MQSAVGRRQKAGFNFRWTATIVVRPTHLYIIARAVIPAKAGIQFRNTGFRVKPGMKSRVKEFLTHYISHKSAFRNPELHGSLIDNPPLFNHSLNMVHTKVIRKITIVRDVEY